MSDEFWRAQSTPEAIRTRETDRIRQAATQRGQDMSTCEAREAADRVIEGREAAGRQARENLTVQARERAQAGHDRAPAPAGQMVGRRPWEAPARGLPRTRGRSR
jgi:hypothetical protein